MNIEDDLCFWEWLKEHNSHKENVFDQLVLELPLPTPRQDDDAVPKSPSAPFAEYEIDIGNSNELDDIVIYQF